MTPDESVFDRQFLFMPQPKFYYMSLWTANLHRFEDNSASNMTEKKMKAPFDLLSHVNLVVSKILMIFSIYILKDCH